MHTDVLGSHYTGAAPQLVTYLPPLTLRQFLCNWENWLVTCPGNQSQVDKTRVLMEFFSCLMFELKHSYPSQNLSVGGNWGLNWGPWVCWTSVLPQKYSHSFLSFFLFLSCYVILADLTLTVQPRWPWAHIDPRPQSYKCWDYSCSSHCKFYLFKLRQGLKVLPTLTLNLL